MLDLENKQSNRVNIKFITLYLFNTRSLSRRE